VFLKVLGVVLKTVQIAGPLAEIAGQVFLPGVKTGPQKLEIVRQAIKQSLLSSELLMGKEIVDENMLDSAIEDFASGVAKVQKAIQAKS
jgi:hypothetical protein